MEEDPQDRPQDPESEEVQDLNPDTADLDQSLQDGQDQKPDSDPPQNKTEDQPVQQSPEGPCEEPESPQVDSDQDKEPGGGAVPALVITQAEERPPSGSGAAGSPADPPRPPADQVSCSSDGGDVSCCCDRQSLKSDSISLTSERTASRTSEEDDSTSVAASSVMSLFHRVQLDPLEKDWLKSSALGNMAAMSHLLAQEPNLVMKKTALHWAAKQGRQDAVDMMLRSGADVNARSGYTALHLASIHSHLPVVHALINTYKAKTNLRDYHGKMAVHYWSGCTEVFTKQDQNSGGRFSRGRWTQRYALPSLLLSRSRSQSQLSVDNSSLPQSTSHDTFELQL
ncbi:ankyrin repeat domain-containing protein SOWAHC-like isoform X1 [Xyrichtys novacula]|uniref:Ankyrin repeat domain-containing protein SOWAHC-like isoform X1 n=1 Tax=Xyrichtys novacula TaxID=13765 RepID=A0AAV1F425_XYRNO|nr:ankyrin repeat domain-containing protein SOWAHC-like isoform X1 [Xyrichtys novacula]